MTFSDFQYQDMLARQDDLYANEKYKIILDFLKKQKKMRILNAGCGSGELSFLLAAVGHMVIGADPSEEYVGLAQKNLPVGLSNSCSFFVGSIEDLPPERKYNCVVATDVLEHIFDDSLSLKKLASLVEEGGFLIITVPAMPILFGYHDEQLGHHRRYTKSHLRCLLEDVGSLSIEKLRYFGFTLIPVSLLYSKVFRRPYPVTTPKNTPFSFLKITLLRLLLAIDQLCPFFCGASLIAMAQKRKIN